VEQKVIDRDCPLCGGKEHKVFLETKDFMITKKVFKIVKCQSCSFCFTNPIPVEEEIGSYYKSEEYVSHSSSKKGLINNVYNRVRSFTLKKKIQWVKKHTQGVKLLDIGAGTGHFLNQVKNAGFEVVGLEPDQDARLFAQQEFQLDLKELSFLKDLPNNSMDCLTMWHVLEHVYHLNEDMSEFFRVLKDDGVCFIAVPNMNSYDATYYKEYWAAYDLPRHLYHFQQNTIEHLFQKFDWKLVDVIPMKFDSFYVSMLSEKYKKGSLLNAFWIGLKSNMKASKNGYSSQVYVFKKK
jgi:ubiquinone/menaquinone biosynthesis C-methylase UbiE